MEEHDWGFLIDDIEKPLSLEERSKAIASILRTGKASDMLLRMLAEMIDPDGKNATQYRLELLHKNKGRPKGPNWAIGLEMERLRDVEGLSADEAIYQVKQKFGNKGTSRRACLSALAEARKWTEAEKTLERYSSNPR